jgi:riboflavin synthase alpha subunit
MFTGLIEAVGEVVDARSTAGGIHLRIRTGLSGELTPGDSLAVNGVCLTVTIAERGEVHADVGPETARITTLGSLQRAQPVNLERPLRADARFGGHFVQGHVDGTGALEEVRQEQDARWLTIAFPAALAPYLVRKGSVAVDGISLTVAGLDETRFDVMIIPFTWDHTNLKALKAGDRVNLECDMIGKYVARSLELAGIDARRSGIKAR